MLAENSGRDFEDLKSRLRNQLQGRGLAGTRLRGRTEELPFEGPLIEWKNGNSEHLRDLSRATIQLVEEVPQNGWTADTLEWLVGFIEQARMRDAIESLESVVHRRKWLHAVDDGPRAHMLALRTLRGLWWNGDPNFWLQSPADVKKRYPALIFGGLLDHDFEMAFGELPVLAVNANSAREIARLFASLVNKHGLKSLWTQLETQRCNLPHAVTKVFEDWFSIRKYHIQQSRKQRRKKEKNTTLETLRRNLPHAGTKVFKDRFSIRECHIQQSRKQRRKKGIYTTDKGWADSARDGFVLASLMYKSHTGNDL